LLLEALEDRWLPAVVFWTGLIDNNWSNGLNWSSFQRPGSNDDVIILGNGVVRYTGGTSTVKSLTSTRELQVTSGQLILSASTVARLARSSPPSRVNVVATVTAPRPARSPGVITDVTSVIDVTPGQATPGGTASPVDKGVTTATGVASGGGKTAPSGGTSGPDSPSAQPSQSPLKGTNGADAAGMTRASPASSSGATITTTRPGEPPVGGDALVAAPVGWAGAGVSGGERLPPARAADFSALADELFLLLPVVLPEVELPSEGELAAAGDLAAALLGTGRSRADILPQKGSQLSVVAALVAGEETGAEEGAARAGSPLDELFLNPLELGGEAPRSPGAGEGEVARAEDGGDREGRKAVVGPRLAATGLALAGVAGLAIGRKRRRRKRAGRIGLRREPGR
jgi:hypothetical protein